MSSTNGPQRHSSEDYHAHVTRMEKMTSTCEGPHFPNFYGMFKQKKREEERNAKPRPGLFGRAEHQFDDKFIQPAPEPSHQQQDDDVNSVAGDYIKRGHDKFSVEKLRSIKA